MEVILICYFLLSLIAFTFVYFCTRNTGRRVDQCLEVCKPEILEALKALQAKKLDFLKAQSNFKKITVLYVEDGVIQVLSPANSDQERLSANMLQAIKGVQAQKDRDGQKAKKNSPQKRKDTTNQKDKQEKKKKTAKTGNLETQLKESKKEIVALQEDNTKLTAANAKLEIDNVTLQENLNRSEAAVLTSTNEVRKLRTKIVLVEKEKESKLN